MLTRPEPHLHDKLDALGLVKSLLAHGANPNLQLKKPIIGRHQNLVGDGTLTEGATALARAAKASDVPVAMRALLDGGADATLVLANRTTTAMIAAGGNAPAAEGAGRGDAAGRTRRGRERVQNGRADHRPQCRAARPELGHRGRGRQRRQARSRRDKQGRTALDIALGAGTGGRRQGRPTTAPVVNEKTAALLRELMAKK